MTHSLADFLNEYEEKEREKLKSILSSLELYETIENLIQQITSAKLPELRTMAGFTYHEIKIRLNKHKSSPNYQDIEKQLAGFLFALSNLYFIRSEYQADQFCIELKEALYEVIDRKGWNKAELDGLAKWDLMEQRLLEIKKKTNPASIETLEDFSPEIDLSERQEPNKPLLFPSYWEIPNENWKEKLENEVCPKWVNSKKVWRKLFNSSVPPDLKIYWKSEEPYTLIAVIETLIAEKVIFQRQGNGKWKIISKFFRGENKKEWSESDLKNTKKRMSRNPESFQSHYHIAEKIVNRVKQ